ncbi:hypothetical protein Tsubulata_022785 [Turnera subulata]|uniref:DUF7792 domain-containing protein n=1 Tax=Turnera subulata TaxID=218843 RepID=A0A9Q0F612_9ROSI|nr:hypothetical protein Tsubulata_022785 [Turnera subulata]
MLRFAVSNPSLYDRPLRRISSDITKNLCAIVLVHKCKRVTGCCAEFTRLNSNRPLSLCRGKQSSFPSNFFLFSLSCLSRVSTLIELHMLVSTMVGCVVRRLAVI